MSVQTVTNEECKYTLKVLSQHRKSEFSMRRLDCKTKFASMDVLKQEIHKIIMAILGMLNLGMAGRESRNY